MKQAIAAMLLGILLLAGLTAQQDPLIAVTEIWPPYRIEAGDGRMTGIDIELLEALEERLGVEIEVQRHPFARALEMIRTGEADIITGIAYTPERDEYIAYSSESYSSVRPVFYAGRDLAPQIRSYEDLYGYVIGYSLNSAYFEPFNSDENLTKQGLSTETQVLRMLELGRVDVIIGTNPNLAYDVARLGLDDALSQTSYTPEPNTPLFLGFPETGDRLELYARANTLLSAMLADGSIREILDRYR
jgi:polar amino acid transport system substrate-binding protein